SLRARAPGTGLATADDGGSWLSGAGSSSSSGADTGSTYHGLSPRGNGCSRRKLRGQRPGLGRLADGDPSFCSNHARWRLTQGGARPKLSRLFETIETDESSRN